ncbi:MAG: transposase domain-containing protein [Lysobacterales bacterium]
MSKQLITATLLSLIETAKANGLEPLGYLTRTVTTR